jgi:small subunit ribosomal protein S1
MSDQDPSRTDPVPPRKGEDPASPEPEAPESEDVGEAAPAEVEGEEDFAAMLESYADRMNEDLQVGDKISVTVLSMGEESTFVDTGTKIDGVVETAELLGDDGRPACGEGDRLELYVVHAGESEIRLSRALAGVGGLEQLRGAQAAEIPVQGKVLEAVKGGFRIEALHHRAFCPVSQMDVRYVEEPAAYVGETFAFLVMRVEDRGRNIVVSRRKLLEREQEKARDRFLETVRVDDVVEGTVVRVMPYGAFVELVPGVEGMVHVSELSWGRVGHPGEVVSVGERMPVQVLSMEKEKGKGRLKIALSRRKLASDPWDTVGDRLRAGDHIEGTVTRCADFGAFVEIFPGVEGLVHISELSYVRRVIKAEDEVRPGQVVTAVVKDVDVEKRRISLSVRDAEGDPWEEVGRKIKVGQTVTGTVERRQPFGLFVQIAPGITGLLPKSKIARSAESARIESLREGASLPVVVEEIHPRDRKITLAPGDAAEAQDWQRYAGSVSGKPSGGGMSDLAEKLKQALGEKNRS